METILGIVTTVTRLKKKLSPNNKHANECNQQQMKDKIL